MDPCHSIAITGARSRLTGSADAAIDADPQPDVLVF
jgi:hypothetical protein